MYLKIVSIIYITFLFYSCSSSSFYQRQYLRGRYVDKMQNLTNPDFQNYSPSNHNTELQAEVDFNLKNIILDNPKQIENNVETLNKVPNKLSDKEIILNNINFSDSTTSNKSIIKKILTHEPKKVFKKSWTYLGLSFLIGLISIGLLISGAITFNSAFFGGLEALALLLIPVSIVVSIVFYRLILLYIKGFDVYPKFNLFNKLIFIWSIINVAAGVYLISFGLAATIIGALVFLFKGILFLLGFILSH
ncbi:MAG: hypothetical protein ACK4IK_01030 [Bacteroidia bacterium]